MSSTIFQTHPMHELSFADATGARILTLSWSAILFDRKINVDVYF